MALNFTDETYYRQGLGGDIGQAVPMQERVGVIDYFAIVTTQNTVTLSQTPADTFQPVYILKNGILLNNPADYIVSTITVTFVSNLVNGDKIRCFYVK